MIYKVFKFLLLSQVRSRHDSVLVEARLKNGSIHKSTFELIPHWQMVDDIPALGSAAIKFKSGFGRKITSLKPLAAMSLVCNILQLIESCHDIINLAKTGYLSR